MTYRVFVLSFLLLSSGVVSASPPDTTAPKHASPNGGSRAFVNEKVITPARSDNPELFDNLGRCDDKTLTRLSKLLEDGANVNSKDTFPWNPQGNLLHRIGKWEVVFCSRVDLRIIQLLIDRGINVNAVDSLGNTALHTWLRSAPEASDIKEIVPMLIKAGADLNLKNNRGETPLDIAVDLLLASTDIDDSERDAIAKKEKVPFLGSGYWHLAAARKDLKEVVRILRDAAAKKAKSSEVEVLK